MTPPAPSREPVVGVVGAGIVGLAIGREIGRRRPGTRVLVLEKEDAVAVHQTGHNSGVVHAGVYYPPGSLKARLCTRGMALLREHCADRGISYQECGKLIVAVDQDDVARLDTLHRRADANAVPGLRRLGPAEIRDVEPHATGLAALHSPRTAITDFPAIARSFADDIVAAGGQVRLSFPVRRIAPEGDRLRVSSSPDDGDARDGDAAVLVDRLVVCAGLHSDAVARLAGDEDAPRIVPFRGEYMRVSDDKAPLVRGLIYPVPDPRYPFLGVHFHRKVSGDVEVGPNAVLALAREGYRRSALRLGDVRDIVTWPGTWRMARRHWRTGLRELRGSLSTRAYMREAQRYVPGIGPGDVERDGCGVRAQAVDRDGRLVDDFRIHQLGPITAVRNAPSPAATSCLAIAEHVVDATEST